MQNSCRQHLMVIASLFLNLVDRIEQQGIGVRVLAEMAGHASIQTTQRYIDVNDEQMRCAAELI